MAWLLVGGSLKVRVDRLRRSVRYWSSVGVAAVADIHDGDNVVLVVDGVSDAVFPAAGAPLTLEWLAQRRSDPVGIAGEGTVEEFHAGVGRCFGKSVGQLARRCPCDSDSVGHRCTSAGQRPPGCLR